MEVFANKDIYNSNQNTWNLGFISSNNDGICKCNIQVMGDNLVKVCQFIYFEGIKNIIV